MTAARRVVLCDLDGVVWLAHRPIPGSVEALHDLRAAGHRVLFVTNNSAPLMAEHEGALARIGVDAAGDVLSSAQAAAVLLQPGQRVLVAAGEGVAEALRLRGLEVLANTEAAEGTAVDAVVVGLHRTFDYEGLRRASTAVRRGARLIAANDDPTFPTPDGPIPGGGAIVAAVERASGVHAEVAGKPHAPMATLVRSVIGDEAATGALMIGDRPDTDGLFAGVLGCQFALVLSGVTAAAAIVGGMVDGVTPDGVFADLRAVADHDLRR
jgi:4-nitrophenyl phosphatase